MQINPTYKSMFALLKIRQLIEAGYGGNVTTEEKQKGIYYSIRYDCNKAIQDYCVELVTGCIEPIAFHEEEQVEEFLSYPENVQLLNDYYMI